MLARRAIPSTVPFADKSLKLTNNEIKFLVSKSSRQPSWDESKPIRCSMSRRRFTHLKHCISLIAHHRSPPLLLALEQCPHLSSVSSATTVSSVPKSSPSSTRCNNKASSSWSSSTDRLHRPRPSPKMSKKECWIGPPRTGMNTIKLSKVSKSSCEHLLLSQPITPVLTLSAPPSAPEQSVNKLPSYLLYLDPRR